MQVTFPGDVCSVAQLCLILCGPMDCSQAPLFLVLFQQEYWSELPFPPPVHLLYPSVELTVNCGPCISRQLLYHLITQKALLGGRGDLNKEKILKAYKLRIVGLEIKNTNI